MKYKFLIIVVIIFLNSCHSQKQTVNNIIMIPKIDKTFEKFNIAIFKNEVDSISGKRIIKTKEKYLEEEIQSYGYIRREFYNDSYFVLIKKFNIKGIILEKTLSFINGYPIGFWYKFDKDGNLIKEIDTDNGYKFGWKKIIEYCKENKIEISKGYPKGGYHTSIDKDEKNDNKVWIITHMLINGGKVEKVTLDGKSGKVISREKIFFVNN